MIDYSDLKDWPTPLLIKRIELLADDVKRRQETIVIQTKWLRAVAHDHSAAKAEMARRSRTDGGGSE
jgi:hypothetical protein